MGKTRKPIASFASEAEERAYWEARRLDRPPRPAAGRSAVRPPNPQPGKAAISLRAPVSLLEEIKIAANRRGAPYQSLIKMWLSEKVG